MSEPEDGDDDSPLAEGDEDSDDDTDSELLTVELPEEELLSLLEPFMQQ